MIEIEAMLTVYSAIQLSLLLLRSVSVLRTIFWRNPVTWRFPTGEITLALSIKALRQESETNSVSG